MFGFGEGLASWNSTSEGGPTEGTYMNKSVTTGGILPTAYPVQLEISCILLFIGSATVLLNFMEITLLAKKGRKISIFENWLLNLSVADMVVGGILVIHETSLLLKQDGTQFYKVFKFLFDMVICISGFSSSATLSVIGIDRLFAVKYPLKHRFWMTKRKSIFIIIIIWFSTIAIVIAQQATLNHASEGYKRVFEKIGVAVIIMVSVLFLFVYSMIIYVTVLRKRLNKQDETCIRNERNNDIETVVTCALVVLLYWICMLPHAIQSKERYTLVLVCANSAVNPFVYFFKAMLRRYASKKDRISRTETKVEDVCNSRC